MQWKKKLTALTMSALLLAAPVGTAMAATAVQTLLYGAAVMAMAKKQLTAMDDSNQKQMLASTQQKTGVTQNQEYNERLERIARSLIRTGMIKRDYDVYVNPSKELNAFETIGGVISVNQGMMDVLNDDELAFTLCHEMQHGEKRHAVNGMLKSIGISTLVDVALGGNADVLDILLGSVAINYIDNEVVTMDQEKEADATGFNVMKHTAYNVGGAPSSMQFVYEKYGDLYTEGFNRVISPNNHPQMSSRIEKLAGRVTKWSGNHVQVGGDTVYVHAQPVVRPAADGAYSSRRRAFLVEGNLARVMNQLYGEAPKDNVVQNTPLTADTKASSSKEKKPAVDWQVALDGQHVMVNGTRIMTCAAGDNGTEIVQNLEKALQAKPTMLSKSEISKQNAAWKKKYGYKNPKKEKTKNVKAASA
mgnify:FL=1